MILRAKFSVLGLLLLGAHALAEVSYKVNADMAGKKLAVEVRFKASSDSFEIEIPNWSPGAYILSSGGDHIQAPAAFDRDSKPLSLTNVRANAWRVDGASGEVKVTYSVPLQVSGEAAHFSGPATYVYVVGRKDEPTSLTIEVPPGATVATGLDPGPGTGFSYKAPNYDVLADSPVTLGRFIQDTYKVRGKTHYIVLYGEAAADVDRKKLLQMTRSISEAQTSFFDDSPYSKYVWHFSVGDRLDGAGGLEHLNSTQIGLPSGLGLRSLRVMSHEFFHLWNVKRIRSKPLGPFDYNVLPKTGALYWLEGVTDYYASLLLLRYGQMGESDFYSDLLGNVRSVRANPARLEVSPYESSMRVGEAAGGRGNSSGYKISYYTLGWLAGMLLDLEIRAQTEGKRSLDDVIKALYQLTRDGKPGFEEDEIRRQCVRFGGEALGPFFDKVVMKAGEMPIEDQLAKVGLQIVEADETFVDLGISLTPSKADKGAKVGRVSEGVQGLAGGEIVQAIDDVRLDLATNRDIDAAVKGALASAKPDQPVKLTVVSGDTTKEVILIPKQGTRKVSKIERKSSETADQKELRNGWFYGSVDRKQGPKPGSIG